MSKTTDTTALPSDERPVETGGYIADAPIANPSDDRFRRWPFAQRIAQTLAKRSDPSSIVVGIYGAWGEGKTSVLNFMETELSHFPDVVFFRFNPWRYPSEERLLKDYFVQIAKHLGKSLDSKREWIGKRFGWLLTLGSALVDRRDAGKELADLLSESDIDVRRERVSRFLRDAGKRVIVVMDDIDRLEKAEIQAVFRLVKLTADFDFTAFVLAFDNTIVASALQERFGDNSPDAGAQFLEKIVQVPLRLPPAPDGALREYCLTDIERTLDDLGIVLSEDEVRSFVSAFDSGVSPRLGTPRMAKRYSNALAFALPIMRGEVHVVDLMLFEALRVFYEDLCQSVWEHPEAYLGNIIADYSANPNQKETSRKTIEESVKRYLGRERMAAISLVTTLFPKVKGLLDNYAYGPEFDAKWRREQRIASPTYFSRYFTYSVPANDISDLAVRDLRSGLATWTEQEVRTKLLQMIDSRTAGAFVKKLRTIAAEIPPMESSILARAIAPLGQVFPRVPGDVFFRDPYSQCAMLVGDLVENVAEQGARRTLALDVLRKAEPLRFGVEVSRWLSTQGKDNPQQSITDYCSALRETIAHRVSMEAQNNPSFLEANADDVPALLSAWRWGLGHRAPSEYVEAQLSTSSITAAHFVSLFVPQSWGMESGLPSWADLQQESYDLLAQIVDPDKLASILIQQDPSLDSVTDFPISDGQRSLARAAQQFLAIHKISKLPASEPEP